MVAKKDFFKKKMVEPKNLPEIDTVDGSEILQHLGMYNRPVVNNGINYQPQLVSWPGF